MVFDTRPALASNHAALAPVRVARPTDSDDSTKLEVARPRYAPAPPPTDSPERFLELPESGDLVAQPVGSDATSQAERNGRTYQVVTRHYLLFPLHSGKLSLEGPMLDAELAVSQRRRQYATDQIGRASCRGRG